LIRGYAVTYNQTAFLGPGDGRLERILPGAFSAQLAAGKPIRLQAYTHDPAEPAIASTADGTLTFHEDEFGLGFEAQYEPRSHGHWGWSVVRAMVGRAGLGCSINFARRVKGRRTIDGASVEVVAAAEIDHVALVTNAAYRGTRVWRADCGLTDAPWTVQELAAKWERGRARASALASAAPTFSPEQRWAATQALPPRLRNSPEAVLALMQNAFLPRARAART
jgi:HK97 family phage prohead protease